MRTNHDHAQMLRPRMTGMSNSNIVTVLTDTFVIPQDGPSVYFFDAGSSDKVVRLPARRYENQVVIINTGSTNELDVIDADGVAQVSIPTRSAAIFFAGSVRWGWVISRFTPPGAPVAPTVVGVTTVLTTGDVVVQTNQVGAIVLTLPSSVLWATINGFGILSIADISGNASTNNVTINPSGGQTISGLASLTINTDYGMWRLQPRFGGGWVVV